uniref:PIN domain-containing protein n=1 Tax=Candidatus Kentrum sp. FW TaxID=2126338 RepID=A0A450TCP9_9GAMM|nr:MAG: PIN domain-containing protein [Candidatus Kentron sp. FW]
MILLDTCALLWLASGGGKLSESALERIDLSSTVHISAISGFEVSMKYQKELGDREAVQPLIQAVSDSSQYDRRRAVAALEKLGDKRAIPVLSKAAESDRDSKVRNAATKALNKLEG